MRSFKTEGIIIKRKNYNEADRILTVFTKFHGKIQVKAAGIRRIPSRRSAHVELLNYSLLSLYRGRFYPILTEAQSMDSFSPIKDDLTKVGLAFHLCELIDGLCPENQENTKVFYLLKNILTHLSESKDENSNIEYRNPKQIQNTNDQNTKHFEHSNLENLNIVSNFGFRASDLSKVTRNDNVSTLIHDFEIELLTTLGYYSKANILAQNFNTHNFIENILERKLKSYPIFAKLQ